MIEWRFTRGVQPQTEKFMEGFGEVIPIEWLQYFDEAELEMILCGVQNIDIADWEKNTVLKNYQKNSKQVNSMFTKPNELSLFSTNPRCKIRIKYFLRLSGFGNWLQN